MKSPRSSLPLLLALTLLFALQGAAMHSISHTLAEQHHDQSLPHNQQCDLCAAYAQMGSAACSDTISFDFASPEATALTSYFPACRPLTFAAFTARAPPYAT